MRIASSVAAIVAMALLPAGCTQLRLEQPLRSGPNDWEMYGGEAGRPNATPDPLTPPLGLAWEFDAGAGFGPSAAAVEDSVIFVSNLQGEIHAVNIHNGKQLGAHDFGTSIFGTPVVDHEMLYVALDGDEESLIGYNLQTSVIEWRAKVGDIESSLLLMRDRLYATTLNGKLVCLKKNSGQVDWTFEVPGKVRTKILRSSPASDGSSIVFGSDCGNVYAVNARDGKLRWSASARESIVASPSVAGGKIFVGSLDSTFYCFDAATGKQVWTRSLGTKIFGSQAVGGDRVIVGCAGRLLYCLAADDGRVLWSFETSGVINAAPLISGEIVYAGCLGKTLYALDARSGTLLWHYETEGRIKTVSVISQGTLLVLAEDRSVLAFTPEGRR